MPVQITLRDEGTDAALAALSGKLGKLRPVMRNIGEALLNSTRQRFSTESGPDGAAWAPLSPAYAKWKARRGRSSKILQLNGYLFGSLTYQASNDRVEVGTNRVYAAIHQFGGQVFAGQRAGHVRLRTDAAGNPIRRKDKQGKETGLAVFARRGLKRYAIKACVTGYHEINIPARPFLGISAEDRAEIGSIIGTYLIGR